MSCQISLKDSTSLVSATDSSGNPILVWDEGFGGLWAVWIACGNFGFLRGIVRAQSWEEAFECAEDEIFEDPDPETLACYETRCWIAQELGGEYPETPEGVHCRSNGIPSNPGMESSYCWEEPMGVSLVPLASSYVRAEGIKIMVRS